MSKNIFYKYLREINIFVFFGAALILLILISIFLWKYILRPAPLADILPLEDTVFYAQINVDPKNPQTSAFFDNLYLDNLSVDIKNQYQILSEDIKPWISKSIGIAVILFQNNLGVKPIVFAEVKNKSEAKKFLQKIAIKFKNDYPQENKYGKFTIYTYKFSQNFAFAFIDNYLAAAENIEVMENFIDKISASFTPVSKIEEYKNANSDYFDLSLGHAYINPNLLISAAILSDKFSEEQKYLISNLKPVADSFKNVFIKIDAEKDYIKIKDITNLKSVFLKNQEEYEASLANYMPQDISLFYGGSNITQQIESFGRHVKDIINIQIKSLIGDSILFERDILPLLKGEYAFAIENNGSVLFAFKADDPISIDKQIKTLMTALKRSRLMLKTKIVEVELPNGDRQKESIEAENMVISSETDYKGFKISGVKIENAVWGVYYTLINNVVLIGSNESAMKNMIDSFIEGKTLASSDTFKIFIKPLIRNSDEIFYMSAAKYFDLKPISIITAGRKYEGSVIKTVYYLTKQ